MSDSSAHATHLRLIHFTVLVASIALIVTVSQAPVGRVARAHADLQRIRDLAQSFGRGELAAWLEQLLPGDGRASHWYRTERGAHRLETVRWFYAGRVRSLFGALLQPEETTEVEPLLPSDPPISSLSDFRAIWDLADALPAYEVLGGPTHLVQWPRGGVEIRDVDARQTKILEAQGLLSAGHVHFSPDGKRVRASAILEDQEHLVLLEWRLDTPREPRTIELPFEAHDVALSPFGRYAVVAGGPGAFDALDLENAKSVSGRFPPDFRGHASVFDPIESGFAFEAPPASGSEAGARRIQLYSLPDLESLGSATTAPLLAVGVFDGVLAWINRPWLEARLSSLSPDGIGAAALAPHAVLAAAPFGELYLVTADGTERLRKVTTNPRKIAYAQDFSRVAVATRTRLHVLGSESRELDAIPISDPSHIAWAADASRVAVTHGGSEVIYGSAWIREGDESRGYAQYHDVPDEGVEVVLRSTEVQHRQHLRERAGKAAQERWGTASFERTFRALDEVTKRIQDVPLDQLEEHVHALLEYEGDALQVVGVSIPSTLVRRTGALILVGLLVYFVLHARAFPRTSQRGTPIPWIALYDEPWSRRATAASLGLAPVLAAGWITWSSYRAWDNELPGAGLDLTLNVLALGAVAWLAGRALGAARTLGRLTRSEPGTT